MKQIRTIIKELTGKTNCNIELSIKLVHNNKNSEVNKLLALCKQKNIHIIWLRSD